MNKISLFIFYTLVVITAYSKTNVAKLVEYVKNEGQWEKQILYKADLSGAWAFLEKNGITYSLIENSHQHTKNEKHDIVRGHAYQVKWLNSNATSKVYATEKQAYYNNYFVGNSSNWKSNVGIYRTIHYDNIYPNIDFKIYSQDKAMKSDYIVHTNGNVNDIQFQFKGMDKLSIEQNGNLKIKTSIADIYELKPYAFQIINGETKEVPCLYQLSNNVLSFILPNGYNKLYDLTIDPTLVFSSYSGSLSDNWGSSATHDHLGNMFLGGITLGAMYPTTLGAFQTNFGGGSGFQPSDIVITKFNNNGSNKLFSTYLGGSSNELLASLISTPNNELIAVMATSSTDFPTTSNAFDKTFNGGNPALAYEISFPNGADLAITKFNATGTALIGSSFFGGTGNDGTNLNSETAFNYGDESRSDVALDIDGNIYITSTTTSTDIPNTSGKAQANFGGGNTDGLVAKFNADLSVLNWASYFGGSGNDASYSMAIDKNKNIFICGGTNSSDILSANNGLHSNYLGGSTDGFVAKFSNNGNTILSSTYIGTNSYDQSYIIDLDNNDNVYLFGQTLGDYPVSANVYSNDGAKQFIHKLNNALNISLFSTVFGSENSTSINISPTALLVDVCENIYAVGWGGNVNYRGNTFNMALTNDAFKNSTDGSDFYLINLGRDARSLKYATYFGEDGGIGDHVDGGTSRFDKNGIVYQAVCASCGATNAFPTTAGVAGPNNNSDNCNMAGFKFDFNLTGLQIITTTATPHIACAPMNVNFTYTSTQPGTQFFWDFGDGSTSTAEFPAHTYNNAGTYTVKFIIRDPNNCNPVDSSFISVIVDDKKTTSINRSICQGQSVSIGNQTFSTSGTYSITLQAANACDSIVTLHLTVRNSIINNISRDICQGESVIIGTHTYTQTGNYADTFRTNVGCDSIINLQLRVHQPKNSSLQSVLCQGQYIQVGGQTFSETGNYAIHTLTTKGCDSTINLSLQVNPTKETQIVRSICDGEAVTIGNQTFTTTGNHVVTLKTSQNCDSVIQLALSVFPKKITTLAEEICEGSAYTIGNQAFTTSGVHTVTLQSSNQCDSIVQLTLTVNPKKTTDLKYVVCNGTTITVGTQTFTTSGNYTIPLISAKGCDSTVFLDLTETDTIIENIEKNICLGQQYSIGTQTFNETGNYTVYLTANAGCDSVVNLSLHVLDTLKETINRTICKGDSIAIGTQIFKTSGNFSIPLLAVSGCDSLVNLQLEVIENPITPLHVEICAGEQFTIGNQTLSENGEYDITFTAANTCDSIVHLTLIVHQLPIIDATADKTTALSTEPIQLNVITNENLTYNWSPAQLLEVSTLQNPIAHIQSSTWFIVSAQNKITQCIALDSVFIALEYLPCVKENIYIPNAFSPNGDGVNDILFVRSSALKNMHLFIYNRWGLKVFETDDISKGWDGTYNGQPSMEDAYGYYLKGECLQGDEIILKGNITILR